MSTDAEALSAASPTITVDELSRIKIFRDLDLDLLTRNQGLVGPAQYKVTLRVAVGA